MLNIISYQWKANANPQNSCHKSTRMATVNKTDSKSRQGQWEMITLIHCGLKWQVVHPLCKFGSFSKFKPKTTVWLGNSFLQSYLWEMKIYLHKNLNMNVRAVLYITAPNRNNYTSNWWIVSTSIKSEIQFGNKKGINYWHLRRRGKTSKTVWWIKEARYKRP